MPLSAFTTVAQELAESSDGAAIEVLIHNEQGSLKLAFPSLRQYD